MFWSSFPQYFAGGCLKSFFLPGVHNPLLLSDDFNPALPRQSSVVIWELPCASHDKSHQEFLAFERCRWGKGFSPGLGPGGDPLSSDSPGTAAVALLCPFPDTSGWEVPGLETGKPHSREECPPGTLATGTQVLQEQLLALCTSLCESPC